MTHRQFTVLSIAALRQAAIGCRPATTLLVGAAMLRVRSLFGDPAFDLQAHASLVGDNPSDTIKWITDNLPSYGALLLWRPEDIVVPALVSVAETTADTVVAAAMLKVLNGALAGTIIDVAAPCGGALATSFDRIAHGHGLPYVPMTTEELAEAYRTFCHGAVLDHLRTRALTTWRLHLQQADDAPLTAATERWLGDQAQTAEAR